VIVVSEGYNGLLPPHCVIPSASEQSANLDAMLRRSEEMTAR
jgi:hypothetical protein